jgi:hypothetical protein
VNGDMDVNNVLKNILLLNPTNGTNARVQFGSAATQASIQQQGISASGMTGVPLYIAGQSSSGTSVNFYLHFVIS